MNTKPSLASASLALGTVGLLVLAVASGCGPAQGTPFEPGPDAAAPVDVDGDAPDAGDMPDGSTLDAGGCAPGTADCDGDPRTGCETKVSSDAKNCGACRHDCTGLPHVMGATSCSAGKCVVPTASCATGFAHCSSNPDDGCEADLSKPATCGKCGTTCSGTTPVCASGTCSNGCGAGAPTLCSGSCVDTTKSATNCASCGNACPIPSHGQATCASSQCGFACNSGYHACGNACADNTSPQTCGGSCTPCGAPANGYATCDGTSCGFECTAGFHKCGNACAADTDATQCGASCTVCTVPSGAGHATCGGGSCGISCDTGNHLCNGTSCASNGSTATCGTSCTPCAAPAANGHSTCDGTSCGIACDASYHQCGGSCASNNVVQSCGASCSPCATPANAQATCNGVSCGYTCTAGFADCDGNAANGCEVNLASDQNNCSACTHKCLGGACSGSTCQPSSIATIAGATAMALDTATIYVAGGSSVFSVPKTGGGYQLLDRGVGSVRGVAIDASNVYWTDTVGRVMRTAKVGATNQVLYDYSGVESDQPSGVAVTGGRVFWISSTSGVVAGGSVAADGTGVQLLRYPGGIGPSPYMGNKVYAFANGTVFLGEHVGQFYGVLPYSPGGPQVVTDDINGGVATDGTFLYYSTPSTNEIRRVLWSGAGDIALASNQDNPRDIVLDGARLYWVNSAAGTVVTMPAVGGTPQVLASGQNAPSVVLTDAAAIYWINSGNGQVMKLAK